MEEIKVKYFTDDIDELCYVEGKSDWIDLHAAETVTMKAGEFRLIPLGVAIALPEGYEAHIVPRSSTFKNYGILQTNSMGVVDYTYRGDGDQWRMPGYATRDVTIEKNARICQFRIMKNQPRLTFTKVEHLDGPDRGGFGCAKLVVFCNAVEDNPFMAGAFHGVGEPDCIINVGVSGPGVVHHALKDVKGQPFDVVAETIKKTAFRVTRMGQLVAQEASRRLGVPFGIVDLSLAPTPAVGDSVARILEEMGLEVCGTHGTTAALALLNDAVKKGGVMASSHVGGLSGAFIPVSEDEGMIAAASSGALTLDKLEAMTCVCSVGLDMIAVPGDTSAETLSAIIADEAAIGMVNSKTTAVRLIPAPGRQVGDLVEFGGLLGSAPVQPVHPFSARDFVARGGRIPAPMQSLKN